MRGRLEAKHRREGTKLTIVLNPTDSVTRRHLLGLQLGQQHSVRGKVGQDRQRVLLVRRPGSGRRDRGRIRLHLIVAIGSTASVSSKAGNLVMVVKVRGQQRELVLMMRNITQGWDHQLFTAKVHQGLGRDSVDNHGLLILRGPRGCGRVGIGRRCREGGACGWAGGLVALLRARANTAIGSVIRCGGVTTDIVAVRTRARAKTVQVIVAGLDGRVAAHDAEGTRVRPAVSGHSVNAAKVLGVILVIVLEGAVMRAMP